MGLSSVRVRVRIIFACRLQLVEQLKMNASLTRIQYMPDIL